MAEFSSNSSDQSPRSPRTDQPMEQVSDWQSYSWAESSGIEQSFHTAYAAISRKILGKVSRKSRFMERFDSFKLTKENLTTLEAGYTHAPPKPASTVDHEFRPEPSLGVNTFRTSRKPLPESAREIIQKMRNEAVARDDKPPASKSDSRPSVSRSNTNFTDFLPYHQVRTWQQDDNEEWQRRRAQSLSAVASEGMRRFNSSCDNLSIKSKKTANQFKNVIKRRMLDHDE